MQQQNRMPLTNKLKTIELELVDYFYSWEIIDKRYLPKGHRGTVYEYLPQEAVSYTGLSRHNKAYYLKLKKEETKRGE